MNKNCLCSHYCIRSTHRCCDYRSQETCCAYSLPIEEIVTWICIGSLIVFFYNTIKLCLIIGLLLWILYWICQQTNIPRLLKEIVEKKFISKTTIDESPLDSDVQLDTPVAETNPDSLSTKSLLNSNLDDTTHPTSNNDYTKIASSNSHDVKTLKRIVSEKNSHHHHHHHPSRIKKLLTNNEQLMIVVDPSETSIEPDPLILHDIRQSIEHLHDDILQLRSNSTQISDLSFEDQTSLQLATENLIRKIMSNKLAQKTKSSSSLFDDNDRQQAEEKSKQSSQSRIDHSAETHLHYPKCVTAQPSFAVNSIMPSVPTRATFIAIDEGEEDEGKSVDNYISTSQHIITRNEQFENIIRKNEQTSERTLLLKDSMTYKDEQPNWAYYSLKPDLFPTTLESDLPVVQPDDQHSSLKQTILSHFHRRSKLTSGNNLSTFHSSSLNAIDHTSSIESSVNIVWKKTLNHVKQGIFRVRKSRIIVSFDNIPQESDRTTNQTSTKITNRSILFLLQSFHSTIQQDELSLQHDKSIDQDHGEHMLEIRKALHDLTSQFILP